MDDKNTVDMVDIVDIEPNPPQTVELPPPPRMRTRTRKVEKAEVPPAPPSVPIDNNEPQLDSVALETAKPSPLPEDEQPSYPQHQLIIERRKSGIMLRTLFFATIGFGLGILIGVGFLLS